MGLHPADVVSGYSSAGERLLEFLEGAIVDTIVDGREKSQLEKAIRPVLAAKHLGIEAVVRCHRFHGFG